MLNPAFSSASPQAYAEEIGATLRRLLHPGQVVEMRILHTARGTVSGYFSDVGEMTTPAAWWSGKVPGIYFTLNPVNPALLARATTRLVEYAKQTTSDPDIVRRVWLPFDFDAVRPAGISSTEEEHQRALARAEECLGWLISLGFPEPSLLRADSGNGGHVLVAIDLPNDPGSTALVKRCIEAVALRFSDDVVAVDLSVFNAARIWKLYGTLACKGDSTPERPHRPACILDAPNSLMPVSRELLEKLAALAPEEPKADARHADNGQRAFNLPRWIAEHCPDACGPYPWGAGQKWIFSTCPWNSDHTNKSVYIVQLASGAIAAGCHHNGCQGKAWHDLRDLLEPGWREHRRGAAPPWPSDEDAPWRGAGQADGRETPCNGLVLTKLGDLLNEPEESIDWLIDKTLPAGGFSLLVAKPKAGKSTLARNLALTVAQQGRDFFGKPTQHGPVIYLALEEKRSEVKKHFRDMGATGEEEIYIFAASAPVDALQLIRAEAEQKKPVLIIIDPLFRLTRVKDGNDYAQVTAALEPLLVLARETGAHVLCVHHAGKGDREGGDSILGSMAIFAAVDTALMMKRTERYRTISSQQRYGEDLPETTLRFDPQTRTITLGESKEQEEEKRIAEAILEFLETKQTPAEEREIQDEVEGRKAVKVRALRRLVEEEKVYRQRKMPDVKNNRGNPFLYAPHSHWFTSSPYINGNLGTSEEKPGLTPQEDLPFTGSRSSEKSFTSSRDFPESQEPASEPWEDDL